MDKILVIVLLNIFSINFYNDFYSFQLKDIDGKDIPISAYKGKKVLIVNIASRNTVYNKQLYQLDSLYLKYKNKLLVIGVPSNSFNNEPKGNKELSTYLKTTYHFHFPVTALMPVTGSGQSPLYKWLSHDGNGNTSVEIKNDFYKFLIDENGQTMGFFASPVSPMDQLIQKVLQE